MEQNDLQDPAFGQWLISRHLRKKHVLAGEEQRVTDYSKHYNSVENTSQLNFGLQFGKRGSSDGSLVDEKYINFIFSMTFNDKWFKKRKIE